ncbi:MAG: FRG domain-containing protein [Acidobacteriota bacterium]
MAVKETKLDSVDVLFSWLRPSSGNWPGPVGSWIFRGQKDSKWGLRPLVFRKDIVQDWPQLAFDGTIGQQDFVDKEVAILRRFVEVADSVGIRVPGDCYEFRVKDHIDEWPPMRYMEILAIAKHHGMPTRLLDFTYSGLIASFFAAIECFQNPKPGDIDGEMAVWAFNLGKYNEMTSSSARSIQIVTVPTHDNNYLYAQKALFIYDRLLNERWKKPLHLNEIDADLDRVVLNDLQKCEQISSNDEVLLQKIVVPKHKCREVIGKLHAEGIHLASVMPSYDNIVKQLRLEDQVGIKRI